MSADMDGPWPLPTGRIELLGPEPEEARPVARMHPDGRVIPEATYAQAAADGGASWLAVNGYTIQLVPASPPARQPLTEEQIVMDGLMMLPSADAQDCATAFIAGVRFAERRHGITAPSASEG